MFRSNSSLFLYSTAFYINLRLYMKEILLQLLI